MVQRAAFFGEDARVPRPGTPWVLRLAEPLLESESVPADMRHHQIPTHKRERGGVAGVHFGKDLADKRANRQMAEQKVQLATDILVFRTFSVTARGQPA